MGLAFLDVPSPFDWAWRQYGVVSMVELVMAEQKSANYGCVWLGPLYHTNGLDYLDPNRR